MDASFAAVLEIITKLNDVKDQHLKELFILCINSANLLIGVGNTGTKQINSFVNKMFKMADQYMSEYNAKLPANAPASEKLSRNMINRCFEIFKKKKDSQANEKAKQTSRQSAAI